MLDDKLPWQGTVRQFRVVAHDESTWVASASLDVGDRLSSSPPRVAERIVVVSASDVGLAVAADVRATPDLSESLSRFVAFNSAGTPANLRRVYQEYVNKNHAKRVSLLISDGWEVQPDSTFKTDPFNPGITVLPSVNDHARAHWSANVNEFRVLATNGNTVVAWSGVVGTWDLTFKEPVNASILQRQDLRESVVFLRKVDNDSWRVVQEVRVR
jgi:hypothetical protein